MSDKKIIVIKLNFLLHCAGKNLTKGNKMTASFIPLDTQSQASSQDDNLMAPQDNFMVTPVGIRRVEHISDEEISDCLAKMSSNGEEYRKIRAVRTKLLLEIESLKNEGLDPARISTLEHDAKIFNEVVRKIREACQAGNTLPQDSDRYSFSHNDDNESLIVHKAKSSCVIQ